MGQAMKALKRILPFAAWIPVFGYLITHAADAEHGIRGGIALETEIARAEAELQALTARRVELEDRVARLDEDSGRLDLDYLEERARDSLGFVHPDDFVIRLDRDEFRR